MQLIADGKEYTNDFNIIGFLGLGGSALLFFVFILVFPLINWGAMGGKVTLAILGWCFLPIFATVVLVWVSTRSGCFFKTPLKVFDEGISMQPEDWIGLRQAIAFGKLTYFPFKEISKVEFFMATLGYARGRVRGCRIRLRSGEEIFSLEHFRRNGLIELVEKVKPHLLTRGFVETQHIEGQFWLSYWFERASV
jgi:hypothetical protein